MTECLTSLFSSLGLLGEMSVTAAYAAGVVLVVRLLLKKRAPRQVVCLLWLVVFARLLIPVSLKSPMSIVPNAIAGQEQVWYSEETPALFRPRRCSWGMGRRSLCSPPLITRFPLRRRRRRPLSPGGRRWPGCGWPERW